MKAKSSYFDPTLWPEPVRKLAEQEASKTVENGRSAGESGSVGRDDDKGVDDDDCDGEESEFDEMEGEEGEVEDDLDDMDDDEYEMDDAQALFLGGGTAELGVLEESSEEGTFIENTILSVMKWFR